MTPHRGKKAGVAIVASFSNWRIAASELSPEQRRHELAAILAVGVLRLRQGRQRAGEPAAPPPKTAPNSAAGRLEVGAETVLSVHTG
jgi:hypothetical protein